MPLNLNCNTCQFDHVSCYNTCHVSGNRGVVRRSFLCGPTKVLWLFLQVLKTSQRGEVLSQFLIYTIMFIFSGVEHRAISLRHRLPAAFLHLQASKVRHRLQGTCDLSSHRAVGRKRVCSSTFVLWLLLQVLVTSPYRGGAVEIYIDTIMIIYFRFPVPSSARGP
jgi:hypothetical protein